MNLEFGLLWIEDSYSPAEEAELRQAAAIAGFELAIENSKDGRNLEELAQLQQKYHLYDLVLLDLFLADGIKGDDLADFTRARFRSTPILFYSGSEDVTSLRQRMASRSIEGVFCAHRSNFIERAGEVISDLALSLNRLSGMRGLSMQVVAESDLLCRKVVSKLSQGELEQFAIDHLNKLVCKMAGKTTAEFPELKGVEARLDHRSVDSSKLFDLFRRLIKKTIQATPNGEAKDRLSALNRDTENYRQEVLEVRNILGHALEVKADNGWQILNRDGTVYMTVGDFPDRRRDFLRNLRAIRDLHQLLVLEKTD